PLPLGGIAARRSLASETIAAVQAVLFDSLQLALKDRNAALPTMRQYAQEFNDAVLMQHVDLYVNQWTLELGDVGRTALQMLSRKAADCHIVSDEHPPLEIAQ
ncbi:MAG: hypothetical protein KDA96_19585, partial [Planctomycetaceae bacterium]|nr:hypothetical protein [Planctomycetaceae bacterium]